VTEADALMLQLLVGPPTGHSDQEDPKGGDIHNRASLHYRLNVGARELC